MKWPKSIVPYITLTREAAKDIIHDPLRTLGLEANLDLRFKENNGDVVLPNGSKIILRGCEDKRQVEKLRGPKYPGAVIDEAQGIPGYLKYMIQEILEPALLDYPGSQIYLAGTPNAACSGILYDIVHGDTSMGHWEVFQWTMLDNESYARKGVDVAAELEKIRVNRGLDVADPSYMREWQGKWVRDTESTVYKYLPSRNDLYTSSWEKMRARASDWEFAMGIDLGWNNPSAFVVAAFSSALGKFVVVDSFQQSEMSTDAIARQIGVFFQLYGDMPVIADSGGYGKSIVEGLVSTYGLPVQPAEKTKKATYIEFLNNELRSASVSVLQPKNAQLAEQLSLLQWSDKSAAAGIPKEDKRSPNHLCDALLYCWRSAWYQGETGLAEQPDPFTDSWFHQRTEELHEKAIQSVLDEDDGDILLEKWLDSM